MHVMVVGGSLGEWSQLDAEAWDRRVAELGEVVAASGARWLTIRPYETGGHPVNQHLRDGVTESASCTVIVDPAGDGRARFAAAMNDVDPAQPVDERTVAEALYAPAEAEPDLVVVIGSNDRLPPSLVWELAYAELVFVDADWRALGPHHVGDAIREFAGRQRRFGGLGS